MTPRTGRWLMLASWVALIYAAVPLVRPLREWIAATVGAATFGYVVLAAILCGVGAGAVSAFRAARRPSPGQLAWLAAIAAVFVWWTLKLWARPEEAVHLVEYALLGVLAHRALRLHVADATVFVSAAIIGTMVGTVDEIIQWLTPERYWDWRDIAINAGASALVQLALWKGLGALPEPLRPRSWRPVCRLATVELVLLASCLANTPARVELYAARVPALGFLASNQNTMTEYGHLHVAPDIGRFRSRFTLAELHRHDASNGQTAGAVLDAFPDGRYGEFLAAHPPGRDPFVHEARVHLFSRDRNLGLAREHQRDTGSYREHITTAVRENRILERHFANTMVHSSSKWSDRRREKLDAQELPDLDFTSKVSAHLITTVAEWQILLAIAMSLVGLGMADHRLGKGSS